MEYCLYKTDFYCKNCDRKFSIDDYELYKLVSIKTQERLCPICGKPCADTGSHMDMVEGPDPTFKEASFALLKWIFKR